MTTSNESSGSDVSSDSRRSDRCAYEACTLLALLKDSSLKADVVLVYSIVTSLRIAGCRSAELHSGGSVTVESTQAAVPDCPDDVTAHDVASDVAGHDVPYFRRLLRDETDRLERQCAHWHTLESDSPSLPDHGSQSNFCNSYHVHTATTATSVN